MFSYFLCIQGCLYTVFKKTCDYVFDDNLKKNGPFATIFGTLITETIVYRQMFLFSHLTYFMYLPYLGNLSRPNNKIMKISQTKFWFKVFICQNGMMHKGHWVNFLTMVGKLEASTVGLRQSKRQPGSGRPRSSRSSGGPCVQSGEQTKKALISSWDFAWNCYSLFKRAQDNSLSSPAQMLQTTSCSAAVWSQSHLSSHSLTNNLVVCNKSCFRFVINLRLNNK